MAFQTFYQPGGNSFVADNPYLTSYWGEGDAKPSLLAKSWGDLVKSNRLTNKMQNAIPNWMAQFGQTPSGGSSGNNSGGASLLRTQKFN